MGWVSLFDPEVLATLLKMPAGSQPIAILCLGHVEKFYNKPMLELENWTKARDLKEFISENYWCE
jgi:5,6-dimethylbenzimidazole synthase